MLLLQVPHACWAPCTTADLPVSTPSEGVVQLWGPLFAGNAAEAAACSFAQAAAGVAGYRTDVPAGFSVAAMDQLPHLLAAVLAGCLEMCTMCVYYVCC